MQGIKKQLTKEEHPRVAFVHAERQDDRRRRGAHERAPHHLLGPITRSLFQGEQHAADGRAESSRQPGGGAGGDKLTLYTKHLPVIAIAHTEKKKLT